MIGILWQTSSAPGLRSRNTYDTVNRADSLIKKKKKTKKKTSGIQGIDKPNKDNRRNAFALAFSSGFLLLYLHDLLWRDNRVHGRPKPEHELKIADSYILDILEPSIISSLTDKISRCRCASKRSKKKTIRRGKKNTKYVWWRLQALLFSSPCKRRNGQMGFCSC